MRRQRLVAASGIVPGIIWTVLFTGAFITIGFTFFFGAANLRAQVVMSGALSILIFLGLLTIVAIDHPFAGSVKVGPEALVAVITDFQEKTAR
jgi:high-affinity Fe2+/Pb2+ permease